MFVIESVSFSWSVKSKNLRQGAAAIGDRKGNSGDCRSEEQIVKR